MQLLEGPAGLDALMLPSIANEQHAVIGAKAGHKFAHLVGACKARFINEIEMPVFRRGIGRAGASQKSLQGTGFDPGLVELACGSRGGRESLHFVAP